jgi:hypothetical protein
VARGATLVEESAELTEIDEESRELSHDDVGRVN